MIQWQQVRVTLGDLQPWPRNPRQIKAAQAKRLAQSFDEFGQVETVAIGPDGEVYNGHQRLAVLLQQHGPDYTLDARQASRPLSEHEREKLTVYLHKGAAGEWDFDTLANEFEVGDLLEWGFEEWELGIEPEKNDQDTEPQTDRAEELRQKWQVEAGQLWQLGDHRLICGDCTDAAVVKRVMGGECPKLMITDPPYGVEYDADWRNEAAEKGLLSYAARRVRKVENDDRADWSDAWKLFPGDVVYCWHADRRASIVQTSLESSQFVIRCQIVWVKPNFPISRGHYTWKHECCWYAVRKDDNAAWIGDATQCTVWEGALDKNAEGGHSTQKPVWLMAKAIANHQGDVYDPFLGSGTTIIACENLGRQCRAVEISPAYVAVALQRYQDHTGREPVLLETVQQPVSAYGAT